MNYLKVYCNLIRKAEKRGYTKKKAKEQGLYVEGHHTFPLSIFGKNRRIVYLTAREHYIAHCLLEKIYIKRYGLKDEKTHKMINAHIMMKSGQYYNSRVYQGARKRFSSLISERMMGHEVGEETRNKISFYSSNRSEETLRKIGDANRGKKISKETRDKMSKAGKGKKKPPGHGEKVSKAKKGKPSALRGRVMPEDHKAKIGNSNAKEYKFINPNGDLIVIHNLQKFCDENGYSRSNFFAIMKGKYSQYRGWRMPV